MYDTIEGLHERDFVLFGVDWGAGTRGENKAQTIAIMDHLMRKKARFALLSFEPQSITLVKMIVADLAKKHNYVEGTDFVNFGYKANQDAYLKGFVLDIAGSVGVDSRGIAISGLPVMEGVKSAHDIKLLIDVTPSDTYNSYIKFMQGSYQMPMGAAVTAVMVPEAVNRFESGQLVGLVPGLAGAIEYEQLLNLPGKATAANISSSAAHFLIIAFIIMGNVAMFIEKRAKAKEELN